jgi:glycolate oxidase iron-sulfur subunit
VSLEGGLAAQEDRLLGCVHCGFCLPACPTYVRLGDEADSPRGRLYLMRAVAEGRLDPAADAFQEHIDRCLGCRACESVCPSGVEYGLLLERARQEAASVRGRGALTRVTLAVFSAPTFLRIALTAARWLRNTGLPGLAARALPRSFSGAKLALGMLAATAPAKGVARGPLDHHDGGATPTRPEGRRTVALLHGCVQAGLFAHVNRATARTLSANGFEVVPAPGQRCCGALHAHAGDLETARTLARANLQAFEATDADFVAVNSAGCGATMKEYGHLLAEDSELAERARLLSTRTRDVSELLAEAGPRRGAPGSGRVAYDAPCHLLHGQGVDVAPLTVLEAIPGVEIVPTNSAAECCGGAGIYAMTHPELGGEIGRDKVTDVLSSGAAVVVTGNPGCIMQIGAELRARGSEIRVSHPVELLDESYRAAGYYGPS